METVRSTRQVTSDPSAPPLHHCPMPDAECLPAVWEMGDASLPLVMVLLAVDTQYNTVTGGGVGVRLLLPLQAIRTAIGEVTKPLTAGCGHDGWLAGV